MAAFCHWYTSWNALKARGYMGEFLPSLSNIRRHGTARQKVIDSGILLDYVLRQLEGISASEKLDLGVLVQRNGHRFKFLSDVNFALGVRNTLVHHPELAKADEVHRSAGHLDVAICDLLPQCSASLRAEVEGTGLVESSVGRSEPNESNVVVHYHITPEWIERKRDEKEAEWKQMHAASNTAGMRWMFGGGGICFVLAVIFDLPKDVFAFMVIACFAVGGFKAYTIWQDGSHLLSELRSLERQLLEIKRHMSDASSSRQ